MREDNQIDFLKKIINLSPNYQEIYDEHLKFNKEIIPHVLMSEITQVLIESYLNNKIELVKATLELIDKEFNEREDDIQNIIAVSMLENFPSSGENGYEIRSLLSKDLLEELNRVNY